MNPFARVERAIEAAGNLPLLEQRRCARRNVVFVDGIGRHKRLVAVAEGCRIEDAVDVRVGAVGGLGEGNLAGGGGPVSESGLGARELPQSQPRQSIFAFAGDEEPREESHVLDHDCVAMRNQLRPVLAVRRLRRRGHQPEVAPAIVGADEPQAVAMVERVLVRVLARGDDVECAGRVVGLENLRFARGVAGRLENDKFAIARAPHADVETLVVFLEDQRGLSKLPG